jgi:hypothetical protein
LTEAARNVLAEPRRSDVVAIVSKHNLGIRGLVAMAAACLFGLACAAVGGPAGVLAIVWNTVVLLVAWRRVGPAVGSTTLGLAAVYGLAALAGVVGDDPEDVDRGLDLRLAVVAVGCAVVGITSVLVWIGDARRRLRTDDDPQSI